MENTKFLSLLGLCRRSGNTVIGTPMVTKSLPQGKIKAVFYSLYSSDGTKKKILDKTSFYGVEAIGVDIDCATLAHSIGKSGSVAAVGITDKNFSEQLKILTSNEKR